MVAEFYHLEDDGPYRAPLRERVGVAVRNWWARALGRGLAWDEGRDTALANAAMVAHDMGRPDIRLAINALIPDGSPWIPPDDPRHPDHDRIVMVHWSADNGALCGKLGLNDKVTHNPDLVGCADCLKLKTEGA